MYLEFLFDTFSMALEKHFPYFAAGFGLGLLSILLGVGLRIGSRLFTSDQGVLHHIYIGIPVCFLC
jgi:hypothetical protein